MAQPACKFHLMRVRSARTAARLAATNNDIMGAPFPSQSDRKTDIRVIKRETWRHLEHCRAH
jgi:hypothetical protein